MPELKLYTVAQLRDWLMKNQVAEGLSEKVIAPTRAWAIIHNPYVKDNDPIVAALFEEGQLAAYTASFPERIDEKCIWWASTLYCYPRFAGRGYGLIVVGALKEAHEPDLTYDRWGAPETVEICSHLGLQTTYTSRYYLSFKALDLSTFKGKMANVIQTMQCYFHPWPKVSPANYSLRYASYIDGEAYAFMQSHRGNDLWLREQDMLNWIIRYPFKQSCRQQQRVEKDLHFTSYTSDYEYQVVKVYNQGQLVGVYVLRTSLGTFAVVYIYYENEHKDIIFATIVDHAIITKPQTIITDNKDLCLHIRQRLYFPKMKEEKVSFSIPQGKNIPDQYSLQLGDGDSFV